MGDASSGIIEDVDDHISYPGFVGCNEDLMAATSWMDWWFYTAKSLAIRDESDSLREERLCCGC